MADKNRTRLEAKSADYEAMQDYWKDVSDILQGQEAIVKAAERYLPKFPKELDTNYKFRLSLAKFTNLFRDIIEGLSAKPFEQEIKLVEPKNPPEQLTEFMDDVDGSGNNITVFNMDTFFNGVAYCVDFIFVDYPEVPTDGKQRSQAEEQELGLRPFWTHIICTNVFEIKSRVINGREMITYIRIFEPANGGIPNRFREMELVEDGVKYTLWKYDQKEDDYIFEKSGPISIGEIPIAVFITGRRKGKTWQFYPALKAALDSQKQLYRAESNLEHIKTMAAFPMLVGQGVKPEMKGDQIVNVTVGPGIALYAPATGDGTQTDWKYIEPAGQSMTFLKSDITDIKQDMRELGKQPLTVSSGNLTTITTAVAAGKSKSAVKTWGISLEDCLANALYFTALWMVLGVEPTAHVYDEYDDILEPGQDAQLLLNAAGQGKLSTRTLWNEWQRRKILSNDFNPEDEEKAILAEVPNGTGDPDNPDGV